MYAAWAAYSCGLKVSTSGTNGAGGRFTGCGAGGGVGGSTGGGTTGIVGPPGPGAGVTASVMIGRTWFA